jgi:hypothetical protein
VTFATERTPPVVRGKGQWERAAEPAATRALLQALEMRPKAAAALLGLSEAQMAGLLAGTLQLVDDGVVVKHPTLGKLGPWARMADVLTADRGQGTPEPVRPEPADPCSAASQREK